MLIANLDKVENNKKTDVITFAFAFDLVFIGFLRFYVFLPFLPPGSGSRRSSVTRNRAGPDSGKSPAKKYEVRNHRKLYSSGLCNQPGQQHGLQLRFHIYNFAGRYYHGWFWSILSFIIVFIIMWYLLSGRGERLDVGQAAVFLVIY